MTNPNGEYKKIWSISGNQGDRWNEGRIQISSEQYHRVCCFKLQLLTKTWLLVNQTNFQVIIETEMGLSGSSDVAIDDISFVTTGCETSPPTADQFQAGSSASSVASRTFVATIVAFVFAKLC